MTTPVARTPLTIPELGPSLGRLVAPPPPVPGTSPAWITLDDIRVALVTQLFELAGDARRWAAEGDRELALATLNAAAWETAWGRAVESVAERAAASISDRLLAAAREARLPARHARLLPLDPAEVRAFAVRLDSGGAELRQSLSAIDRLAPAARTERAPAIAVQEWQAALGTAARRVEAAWIALEAVLLAEGRDWEVEIEEIRAWRRPRWPLVVIGIGLFAIAGYAGLVLGGYLPVPGLLAPLVERIWAAWS